jgi:catechol 2,3-dioxygenase-like lactoylglutathione lyase family enzyme
MNLSAIRLCVSALPAARAFYSETLGLRLTNAGPGHCLFMSSGIRIVIEEAADDEHRALVGIFTGLSFEVPDIEKE